MTLIKELTEDTFEEELQNRVSENTLIEFWGYNCPSCRVITEILEQLADELTGRVTIMKVNVDQNPSIAQELKIKGIPALLLFRGNREIKRLAGILPSRNAIMHFLEETG
jgi:thioredoxin 1